MWLLEEEEGVFREAQREILNLSRVISLPRNLKLIIVLSVWISIDLFLFINMGQVSLSYTNMGLLSFLCQYMFVIVYFIFVQKSNPAVAHIINFRFTT